MERCEFTPRPHWQQRCEDVGFSYHSIGGTYWDERAAYGFTLAQVETLEAAIDDLHQCCLDTVDWIVRNCHFAPFNLPERAIEAICRSWQAREPGLYGRFDFAWDGRHPPKMLEYNADTPTSLLEASVVQWFWLQDIMPAADQFNSIHEKLIDAWRQRFSAGVRPAQVHFAALDGHEEDSGNALYMMDVAQQAGLSVNFLPLQAIGFDADRHCFVDSALREITYCFKLYPWEWLWADEFAPHIATSGIRFIEPAWKLLLSSKAILPLLWQRYPGHPNLLPASFQADLSGPCVRKPIYSREGENIRISTGAGQLETGGHYADQPRVYQAYAPLPCFAGAHTVVGGWVVGNTAAGMGIREDDTAITRDTSRFIPHFIR